MKFLWCILLCLTALCGHAQTAFQDSLQQALRAMPDDTARWNWLESQAQKYRRTAPAKALNYVRPGLEIANKLQDKRKQRASNMLAGNIYSTQGIYDRAMTHYIDARGFAEETNDSLNLGLSYNNIGLVHLDQQNLQLASEYFERALPYFASTDDLYYKCIVLNNLGTLARDLGDYDRAINYYLENLQLQGDSGNVRIRAAAFNNLGYVYQSQGNHLWARDYFVRALKEKRKMRDPASQANTMVNLATSHAALGNFELAMPLLDTALVKARHVGDPSLIVHAYEALGKLYEQQGNPTEALRWFHKYDALSDTLQNEQQQAKLAQLQSFLELEQKDKLITQMNEAQQAQDKLIQQLRLLLWTLAGVLLLAIGLSISLYTTMQQRRKSNMLLSEKNKEILKQREAIVAQNKKLSDQNTRLEELNQEIEAVMHVAAHDLKAPLSRATGLANLISMAGPLNDEQIKYLELIRQVSLNGASMIRDLLDLQNIENNEANLRKETVDLASLLTEATASFEPEARRKSIDLNLDLGKQLTELELNKQGVQRAVENLLSNAIKFSPKNKLVEVKSWRVNGHVCISVRDEGPGILQEEHPKLFKKFQKLSAQPTGNETSSGLGLAITKALIDRLGGQIEVQSEAGQGANFTITLPAESSR